MAIGSILQLAKFDFKPAAPPAGSVIFYVKTDNVIYVQDSAGSEYPFASADILTALHGDVVAAGPGDAAAVVAFVGGKTAAEIAQSVTDTQAATSANSFSIIMKRDSSGNVFVTQINGVAPEAHASRHLPSGADPLTTAAPTSNLNATSTNATGTANSLSRSDHSHAIDTGTPVTQNTDQSNATGSSPNLAKADHIHNIPTDVPVTQNTDQSNTQGSSTKFSKADHIHNIPTDIALDISTSNTQGSSTKFSKADHTHKGVRSVKANSGTQRFGDLSLKNGVGATVTDDGSGNFTIDVVGGANELSASYSGSGLSINYTSGKVIFNGIETFVIAGSVSAPASITNGYVYVDIDGVVKASATLPANTIPLLIFNSGLSTITFSEDARVFLSQNLVWGLVSDIQPETTTSTVSVGTSEKYARADHVHAITSAAPSTQTPDQANAVGSSSSFAKADHIHNIPTAVPVGLDANSTNVQGSNASFARSNHTHDLSTGTVSTQNPDQANAEGTSANLARADHIHAIPTDVAVGLDANSTNTQGAATKFSRADHTHDLSTGVVSTQTPDQSNAEGSSANLARADHIHNIPATAPITTLAPSTTNSEGVAASFARGDHTHAIQTALVADITPIHPDDSASAGTADNFARGDHKHAIVADAAVTINANSTNTEGSSTSFARADHTHDLDTGVVIAQTPNQANAEGTSANLARADHVHNIATAAPTTTLSPATTNADGSAATFSKSDHGHAIATALVADITTIQPDDSAAAGTANNFARGDHKHAIVASTPSAQIPNQANAEGSATSFARADHIHNIATAAPVTQNTDQTNTDGVATTFSKSDHIHNIPTDVPVQIGTTNALGSSTKFVRSDHVHAITWGVVGGLIISTYAIGANAVLTAADTLLIALGKLQGQISAIVSSAITSLTGDVTGTGPGATATTIAVGAVTDTKASLANKPAVTVVATTNQTLSGAPTIDGQATTAGTSIALLTAQTTTADNGPWVVQAGAWTRPTWYPNGGTTQAFQFITTLVRLGTVYGGSTWRQTAAAPITIGTTTTTWVVTPQSGNFKSQYTVGPQSGSSEVDLAFANALVGTLAWNPGSTHKITLPPNLVGAGNFLSDTGSGVLAWTNPNINIDGGTANSVYTASQFISGGTP